MKIKVLSDTHNDHNMHSDLECDMLIHCGDATTKGNFTEVEAFLKWFVKQPAKYKIIVPGNHDRKLKSNAELQLLAREYGIHVLMNESLTINGIKMWGGHYTPSLDEEGKYREWHGLEVRKEAWKDMPRHLDLLITHVPPWGILDTNLEGVHCGCNQLTYFVKRHKIHNHIFGHIHEFGGKTAEVWGTKFYNCAVKDRSYLTVRNYVELEIEGEHETKKNTTKRS